MLLVNRLYDALETTEESFGADERRLQVYCAREFIDYKSVSVINQEQGKRLRTVLEDFIKCLEVFHDDIAMFVENSQSNKNVKLGAEIVGPLTLPQA